jgi:hypothetical protein
VGRRPVTRSMYVLPTVGGITTTVYHISVCVFIFPSSVISTLNLLVFLEIDIKPVYSVQCHFP